MDLTDLLIFAAIIAVIVLAWLRFRGVIKPVPAPLRRGQPLPDFLAHDEQGDPLRSTELHGAPAVILFVRGNWCPFCSKQVSNLTSHYKDIVDLGARLVFITPKPLETTRRVAQFFEVEFEFWQDQDLEIATQLGLLQKSGVPGEHQQEYGTDTVWPTAIVTDAAGIIRYVSLSKFIADRPDPERLVSELRLVVKD